MTVDFKELTLFTRAEAAKALSISKETLSSLIVSGKIGFLMVGDRQMISYRALVKYIEENTVQNDLSFDNKPAEIDLNTMRKQKPHMDIDTRKILKNIMETNNGKHL